MGKNLELRWDPILREWIIVSGKRKDRPTLDVVRCPFCPGSAEVPSTDWRLLVLQNRYPALSPDPGSPDVKSDGFYSRRKAKGVCEVVLYTPRHDTTLAKLDTAHIKDLIDLWTERYRELGRLDYVDYVFIFENKGREIGVTLDHPHGQIYAFPFIPPIIRRELTSSRLYMRKANECLFCSIIEKEKSDGSRIVCENDNFACFLPFFARWPYGVHLYPKRHVQSLLDLSAREQFGLANILKDILTKFDNLFGFSFPYMMVFHQKPTDGRDYHYYHFHIEFYPPYRERDKLKFFASVETGAGTITYDYSPEDKAKELREAVGYEKNL
jgi:UDPglucose--hexose-1-phosphate uridylyltransferase